MSKFNTQFNPSYIGGRSDIVKLIPDCVNNELDIGCGIGVLGEQIKKRNSNVEVVGNGIWEQDLSIGLSEIYRVM